MASILFGLPEAIVSHQKNKERKVQTQHNHTTSNFGCQDQYGVTLAKNPSLRSELALSVAKGQVLLPRRETLRWFLAATCCSPLTRSG
jgi:hypothetical protein